MAMNSGKKKYGRIGVLLGGPSREREISLRSGAAVCSALRQLGLDVVEIDIKSDQARESAAAVKAKRIDCAFLALHGRFGEDGSIQEILEGIKIPYTGSGVVASRLAMDKSASLGLFKQRRLRVPGYTVIEKGRGHDASKKSAPFGLPLVVKPAAEGSSIGLSIIHNLEHLQAAMEMAFGNGDKVIVGEYIRGRELTVGILDEKALPVLEIIPKNEYFDYKAKYNKGMTDYEVPARLSEDIAASISSAALSAHKALGCFGCSRVDLILGSDGLPYILEVNTIPGMTATSLLPKAAQAAGIDFAQLCLKLIDLAYEKK